MIEGESGTEIMMRLSEQSLELVRVFVKQANSFYYFSLQPKHLQKSAAHDINYRFNFLGLQEKYSSRDPVPLYVKGFNY